MKAAQLAAELIGDKLSLARMTARLAQLGYQLTRRRLIDEPGTYRLYFVANSTAPSVSILVERETPTVLDIDVWVVEQPPPFGTPEHLQLLTVADAHFDGTLRDLVRLFGAPAAARRRPQKAAEGDPCEEAFEFANWAVAGLEVSLESVQWDADCPLAVSISTRAQSFTTPRST